MGLSTALAAARQGLSVRVVDAGSLGEGASGLNGGQVIPGLKYDPEWLLEHFGPQRGEALIAFAASTADSVFDLIAAGEPGGAVCPQRLDPGSAHRDRARRRREPGPPVAGPRRRRADADAAEIAGKTGARGYVGGWLDRRAGVINPLAYTLELARAAKAAGARIAEREKADRAAAQRRFVESHHGVRRRNSREIRGGGDQCLFRRPDPGSGANDRAAALLPDRHGAVDAPATRKDLPEGQAVSDSRRILVYYRLSPDGRLVLGGRGRMALPKNADDWAHLQHAMLRLYPALAGVPIEQRWFGRVAMTPDHLPHIHQPEKGLVTAVGCQGRGVGLMTALGTRIAGYLASGDAGLLPFPVSPIRPIPFHSLRQIGVAATIAWYRTLDALER